MHRQTLRIAVSVVAVCAAVLLAQLPAGAITVSGTPSPVTGNATWFSGLGGPYGGCGLPEANVDSQNYLALNVQNSPGVYSDLPRPIPAADAAEIGMWDNGLNCGRWVQVTIGNNCTGVNDGAQNQPFCRNGSWKSDQYNGATLDMVVADSCDDPNAWCKDDPYHVDLHQASLNQFVLNGQPVGNMYPGSWNNRQVTWQFIPAPNYTGDINIGALQGAEKRRRAATPSTADYHQAAGEETDIAHEIWGDAALYFNHNDVRSLGVSIRSLLADPDLRRDYANRALRHAQSHYTAAQMTDEYLSLYKSLISAEVLAA